MIITDVKDNFVKNILYFKSIKFILIQKTPFCVHNLIINRKLLLIKFNYIEILKNLIEKVLNNRRIKV